MSCSIKTNQTLILPNGQRFQLSDMKNWDLNPGWLKNVSNALHAIQLCPTTKNLHDAKHHNQNNKIISLLIKLPIFCFNYPVIQLT